MTMLMIAAIYLTLGVSFSAIWRLGVGRPLRVWQYTVITLCWPSGMAVVLVEWCLFHKARRQGGLTWPKPNYRQ